MVEVCDWFGLTVELLVGDILVEHRKDYFQVFAVDVTLPKDAV